MNDFNRGSRLDPCVLVPCSLTHMGSFTIINSDKKAFISIASVNNVYFRVREDGMLAFEIFERATTKVTRAIALIGLTGLLLLALATVLDVLMRWIFNSPIVGLNDTHSLFTAVVISSCFPLCIYKGGNITIRFIGNFFGNRVKSILDVFGNLLTLSIFGLMGWQLWLYSDQLAEDGATTWVLSWPISPWWRIATIIIMVCVPVAIVTIIQFAKSALGKDRDKEKPLSSSKQPVERYN